jgi:hypothetical protein
VLPSALHSASPMVSETLFRCATAYGVALFGAMAVGVLFKRASTRAASKRSVGAVGWLHAVVWSLWTFLPLEVIYLTLLVRARRLCLATRWTSRHVVCMHVCADSSPRTHARACAPGVELAA